MELLPSGGNIKDVVGRRSSLETFLPLEMVYLNSPITLLGILAPFVTAAITALMTTGK
jgi:hypothetical protein